MVAPFDALAAGFVFREPRSHRPRVPWGTDSGLRAALHIHKPTGLPGHNPHGQIVRVPAGRLKRTDIIWVCRGAAWAPPPGKVTVRRSTSHPCPTRSLMSYIRWGTHAGVVRNGYALGRPGMSKLARNHV